MPGGNRTGPAGMGPMTGRGAGFCAGFGVPGYANPVGGRGFFGRGGRGMGRGRGFGRGFGWAGTGYGSPAWGGNAETYPAAQPLTTEQELEGLKDQAEYLEGSLNQIKERIEALQAQK